MNACSQCGAETPSHDLCERCHDAKQRAGVEIVVHPSHYARFTIEPMTYVVANGLGFLEGNAIKYISRWRWKNGRNDLLKARRIIDMLLEVEERETRIGGGEKPEDVWKVTL